MNLFVRNEIKNWVWEHNLMPNSIKFSKIGEGLIKKIKLCYTDSYYALTISTFELNDNEKKAIHKVIVSKGLDSLVIYSKLADTISVYVSQILLLNIILKHLSFIEELSDVINKINEILNYTLVNNDVLPVWVKNQINYEYSNVLNELSLCNTTVYNIFKKVKLINFHSGYYKLTLTIRNKEESDRICNFINEIGLQFLIEFEEENEYLVCLTTQHNYLILCFIRILNFNDSLSDIIIDLGKQLDVNINQEYKIPRWVLEDISFEKNKIIIYNNTDRTDSIKRIELISHDETGNDFVVTLKNQEENDKLKIFVNEMGLQSLVEFENSNNHLMRLNTQHIYLVLHFIKTLNVIDCLEEIIVDLGKQLNVDINQDFILPRWVIENKKKYHNRVIEYYNTHDTDSIDKIKLKKYDNKLDASFSFKKSNATAKWLEMPSEYEKLLKRELDSTDILRSLFFIERLKIMNECGEIIGDVAKHLNIDLETVRYENWIKYNLITSSDPSHVNEKYFINLNESLLKKIHTIVTKISPKIILEFNVRNWKKAVPAFLHLPHMGSKDNEKSTVIFETNNINMLNYILASLESLCGPIVDELYNFFGFTQNARVTPSILILIKAYQENPYWTTIEQINFSIQSTVDLLIICPKTGNTLLEILLLMAIEGEDRVLIYILNKNIITIETLSKIKYPNKILQDLIVKNPKIFFKLLEKNLIDDIMIHSGESSQLSTINTVLVCYVSKGDKFYRDIISHFYLQKLFNLNDVIEHKNLTIMLLLAYANEFCLRKNVDVILNNVADHLSKETLEWEHQYYQGRILKLIIELALKGNENLLEVVFSKNFVSSPLLETVIKFDEKEGEELPVIHWLLKLPKFYLKALTQKLITLTMLQQKNMMSETTVDLLLKALQTKIKDRKFLFFKTFVQGLIKSSDINPKYNTLIFINEVGQLVFNPDFYIENPQEEVSLLELLGQESNESLKLLRNLFINFEAISSEWKVRLDLINQLLKLLDCNEMSLSYYQEKLLNIYRTLKTLGIDRTLHQLEFLKNKKVHLNYYECIKNIDSAESYYKQAYVDFSSYILSLENQHSFSDNQDEYFISQIMLQKNRYHGIKTMLQLIFYSRTNVGIIFDFPELKLLMQLVVKYVLGNSQELSMYDIKYLDVFVSQIYSNQKSLLFFLKVIQNNKQMILDEPTIQIDDYIQSLQFKREDFFPAFEKAYVTTTLKKELENAISLRHTTRLGISEALNIDLQLNGVKKTTFIAKTIGFLKIKFREMLFDLTELKNKYSDANAMIKGAIFKLEKLFDDKLTPLSEKLKERGYNINHELAYLVWGIDDNLFDDYIEKFIQIIPTTKAFVIHSNTCMELASYLLANASVDDLDSLGKPINKEGREQRLKMALILALSLDKVEYSGIRAQLTYHIAALLIADKAPLMLTHEKILSKLLDIMTEKDALLCLYLLEHFHDWNPIYSKLLNKEHKQENKMTISPVYYHIFYKKRKHEDEPKEEDSRQAKRLKI